MSEGRRRTVAEIVQLFSEPFDRGFGSVRFGPVRSARGRRLRADDDVLARGALAPRGGSHGVFGRPATQPSPVPSFSNFLAAGAPPGDGSALDSAISCALAAPTVLAAANALIERGVGGALGSRTRSTPSACSTAARPLDELALFKHDTLSCTPSDARAADGARHGAGGGGGAAKAARLDVQGGRPVRQGPRCRLAPARCASAAHRETARAAPRAARHRRELRRLFGVLRDGGGRRRRCRRRRRQRRRSRAALRRARAAALCVLPFRHLLPAHAAGRRRARG